MVFNGEQYDSAGKVHLVNGHAVTFWPFNLKI